MTQNVTGATVLAMFLVAIGLLIFPGGMRVRGAAVSLGRAGFGNVPARRAVVGASAVAAAGLALMPTMWWVVIPGSVLLGFVLARRPAGRSVSRRAADRRLIAVHAELLAACLDAGMAVGPALRAVSEVLRAQDGAGPLAVLDAVAAMLSLGADSQTAWRVANLDDELAPLAAAAQRSAAGGGGLAPAVREHAAQLRQETAAASVRAAGRAGVLMTAPLGLCFLPAFLCLGLAPVVVGLLGQLDIF